jgi:hypothetical protein
MTLIEKITNKVQDLPLEASPSEKDICNYYLSINNLIKITEDFAIGFAEWVRINAYDTGACWYYQESDEEYTTKELLEIYKQEKGL